MRPTQEMLTLQLQKRDFAFSTSCPSYTVEDEAHSTLPVSSVALFLHLELHVGAQRRNPLMRSSARRCSSFVRGRHVQSINISIYVR